MKTLLLVSALSLALSGALAAAGCSGSPSAATGGHTTTTTASSTSSTSTTSTTTTPTTTTNTTGNPPPPTIGAQIDRFGRPAINTALNHAFDPDMTAAGVAKDAYNQDGDPTKWSSNAGEFATNLAVLDALDGTCGNQIGYAAPASATSYAGLASVLANDRIWLNTAGATCTIYLAVEVDALNIKKNADCGGRALGYDVIDASYSALAAGAFTGVGDGVAANDVPYLTTFPYLAVPH